MKKSAKDARLHEKLTVLARECSEFSLRFAWIKLHFGGHYKDPAREFVRGMDLLVRQNLITVRSDENRVDQYSVPKNAKEFSDNKGIAAHIRHIKSACNGQPKTQAEISEETGIQEKTIRRYVPILVILGVLIAKSGRPTALEWNFEAEERLRNLTPWIRKVSELRHQVSATKQI
jgi:hypothetical protein